MDLVGALLVDVDVLGGEAERLANLMRSARSELPGKAAHSSETLRQAAQSFEALFYSLLIKQLRHSSQELGEGFFAGDQADIFGGLFDLYLGQFLAQRQQLGIGQLIERHYRHHPPVAGESAHPEHDLLPTRSEVGEQQ